MNNAYHALGRNPANSSYFCSITGWLPTVNGIHSLMQKLQSPLLCEQENYTGPNALKPSGAETPLGIGD